MTAEKRKEFLIKFADLLEEYDVSLITIVKGDTHGIDSEHIEIVSDMKTVLMVRTDMNDELDARTIRNGI